MALPNGWHARQDAADSVNWKDVLNDHTSLMAIFLAEMIAEVRTAGARPKVARTVHCASMQRLPSVNTGPPEIQEARRAL